MTYYPRAARVNRVLVESSECSLSSDNDNRSPYAILWILISFAILAGLAVLGILWIVPLSWFGY